MTKTNIEWCDESWNPLRGCSRTSPGCENCYAEKIAQRFSGAGQPYEGLIAKGGQWNGQIKLVPEKLTEPLRWRKPRRIFVNSMSDLFHENVPFDFIDQVFAVMARASRHTFIILTKRPERMREYMTNEFARRNIFTCALQIDTWGTLINEWPIPNIWLGVSVENQQTADARIPPLLECPAKVRFISAEPLLGPISLTGFLPIGRLAWPSIDWVIAGGESGSNARPSHPDWFRRLRDQCGAANVAFFFKQWGEWAPGEHVPNNKRYPCKVYWNNEWDDSNDDWMDEMDHGPLMYRIGKKKAGNLLDGKQHSEFPALKNALGAIVK